MLSACRRICLHLLFSRISTCKYQHHNKNTIDMNIRNIRSIRAAAALLSMLALSAANPVSAVDATLSDTGNSESNIFDKRGDCYALLEYAINSQVMNSQVNGAESHIYFYGSDGKQTSYHEMVSLSSDQGRLQAKCKSCAPYSIVMWSSV